MKKYLFFAAATLLLAACSNESDILPDGSPTEIRLSSGIEVQTRATHNLDTQLKSGEQVHVWVDDAKDQQTTVTTENLYANNVLTAGGSGVLSGGTAMYFPQTGNAVNIYALHGNLGAQDWTGSFWGQSVTHTVATNQQTGQAADGYALSDLVYAQSAGVARTSSAVNLSFKHLLSKMEVVLVQGSGSPTIAKAEILNTQLEAVFTPNKGSAFSVTASGTITDGNPIQIDCGTTSKGDAAKTDTDEGKVLNEAIIVPQTLAINTPFIRITTSEGGVLIYRLPEEKTFDADKKYRYTVTANLTDLSVSAEITNWTPNTGDDNGTAEME